MSVDNLREATTYREGVLSDPLRMMEVAAPLLHELGLNADYTIDTESYIEEVRSLDPRYRDSRGNARAISRQDVTNRSHLMTDDMMVPAIMHTADNLGILVPAYPFDDFALTAEAVVVTGGTLNALRERTLFGVTAQKEHTFVVGGSRPVTKAELAQLEAEDKDPTAYKTEGDLAVLVAEELDCIPYIPITKNPDNLDVVREFALSRKYGNIALVTTALYVPFTTSDKGVVEAAVPGFAANVYAGPSNPDTVAKRTVDTYRSEIMRTLVGAARWHIENRRRG